jgi:hypothetical protein
MRVAISGRREIMRLHHEISYYCGVIDRTTSRERLRNAYAAILRCEERLEKLLAAERPVGFIDFERP